MRWRRPPLSRRGKPTPAQPRRALSSSRLNWEALPLIDESGERERIARRHPEYHHNFFEHTKGEAAQAPHGALVWQNIDSLRTVLDWAFSPDGDGSIGVAVTAAAVLWMRLSLLEECRSRAKQALGALEPGEAYDLCNVGPSPPDD